MKIVKAETRLCTCCMEEHEVKWIITQENNVFKGVPVVYDAEYFFCDVADEFYADEQMISKNDIAMKNAYRKSQGLLTTEEISAIRKKFEVSQSDLSTILGWGEKTITRYESHQVQDKAHDTILRKLDADPEWFLKLLGAVGDSLSPTAYSKYLKTGTDLFEADQDRYLRSAIMATCARYMTNPEFTGNTEMSLDTVIEMIQYFACSKLVTKLYMVKLVKMLWYADALSYKRRGRAISGMVYQALPMGAVPVAYKSIMNLSGVLYEEVEIDNGVAYHFLPSGNKTYNYLSQEDIDILDAIIKRFGKASKTEIVNAMHNEDAYEQTIKGGIIQYKYTKNLSLS